MNEEVVEEHNELEFVISLDYSTNEADLYSCSEWAALYPELGEYNNNPLISGGAGIVAEDGTMCTEQISIS